MKTPAFFNLIKSNLSSLALLIPLSVLGVFGLNKIQFSATFDQAYFHILSGIFSKPSSKKVAVINIDKKTINELGLGAFSYDSHAHLLRRLNNSASIGFDMHSLAKVPGSLPRLSFIDEASKNGRVVLPVVTELSGSDIPLPAFYSTNSINNGIAFALHDIETSNGLVESIVAQRNIRDEKINHIALKTIQIAKDQGYFSEYALTHSLEKTINKPFMFMLPKLSDIDQYSYVDVFRDRVLDTAHQNKIIYIGPNIFEATSDYRISPFYSNTTSSAQLNALITQALLDGNIIRKTSPTASLFIYAFLAIGMTLICTCNYGRKHRFLVIGWLLLTLSVPMLSIALAGYWLPIGATILVCLLIYVFYMWEESSGMHHLLRREINALNKLSNSLRMKTNQFKSPTNIKNMHPLEEMDAAMRQIRVWHESYVNVINIDIQNQKDALTVDRNALRFMAHDLRTPLSTILALIEERIAKNTSDSAFINSLRYQVDYSLRIAQGIMQVSRAEHLDPKYFTPVLLSDVAGEAIEHIRLIAKEKSIHTIDFILTGDDKFVLGNRDMLLRALVNLLDNSVKHSNASQPITVEINSEIYAPDNDVSIKIIDQGSGIPPHAIKHLFEPFFQVRKSKMEINGGVGLGLPFVKTVVEKHQGRIHATSHTTGTEMCISLPFVAVDIET